MAREGSLEAPTRHPIDWKNPEFYNEQACFKEMERIFDIAMAAAAASACAGPSPRSLIWSTKAKPVNSTAWTTKIFGKWSINAICVTCAT